MKLHGVKRCPVDVIASGCQPNGLNTQASRVSQLKNVVGDNDQTLRPQYRARQLHPALATQRKPCEDRLTTSHHLSGGSHDRRACD
jgi:hypothetical protein